MRSSRRETLWAFLAILLGIAGVSARAQVLPVTRAAIPAASELSNDAPVRLTIDMTWCPPAGSSRPIPPATLELSDGQVIEALAWPDDPVRRSPIVNGAGSPRLTMGHEQHGKVRARIEAPIASTLEWRFGDQLVKLPLSALLDGPQKLAPAGLVEIEVGRVAWDPLEIRLGNGAVEGLLTPGTTVPLLVGTNLLTPEPGELTVALWAELRPIRGGEPVWKLDRQEFNVHTNVPAPSRAVSLPVPRLEGTYVLDVHASWTPAESPDGSRMARWLRRRRVPENVGVSTASRRLTLVSIDQRGPGSGAGSDSSTNGTSDTRVDLYDLSRWRSGSRPLASGRSPWTNGGAATPGDASAWSWALPETAWVSPGRLDRLKGLLPRVGADPALVAGADGSGVAWTSVGLKVAHPGRPHKLRVTVNGGHPSALGVGLVSWHSSTHADESQTVGLGISPNHGHGQARLLLDACASAEPIAEGAEPITFSWPVWPDAVDPVLVLFNRGAAPVRLGNVELIEPAAADSPAPAVDRSVGSSREIGLDLSGPRDLDRFGGVDDAVVTARNLGAYLAAIGASRVVLPRPAADLARRPGLDGQGVEDSLGPDRIDLLIRSLESLGIAVWIDLKFDGGLPGLPPPESPEAADRGLVTVDRAGRTEPSYNVLHPDVQASMIRVATEAATIQRIRPNVAGLLVRLGPAPTLPGSPDTGLDDDTFTRFVREKLDDATARNAPGRGVDEGRFAARHHFLSGPARLPWLAWRASRVATLYGRMSRAIRQGNGGLLLAIATPSMDEGPAGHEARRADLAGLPADQAWRNVGLDLAEWPGGADAPAVLRGVNLASSDLGRDLATSPELDARVAGRPDRGLIVATEPRTAATAGSSIRFHAPPVGIDPHGDELLAHALASIDARRVFLSAASATGREERLREFARVFHALPFATGPAPARLPSGVSVRSWIQGQATFVALANDTPYAITIDTTLRVPDGLPIEDLARGTVIDGNGENGVRRLAIDLPTSGVVGLRIKAATARVASAQPRYSNAVQAQLEAQSRDLSVRLSRLSRPSGPTESGPPNPGFEPDGNQNAEIRVVRNEPGLNGWKPGGDGTHTAEIDSHAPHSGQGCLRLASEEPPASVISEAFVPPPGPSITARFWLRSQPAGVPVRFRIDGEAAGVPQARQTEITPGQSWSEYLVRLADLSPRGLDRARIRFELVGPGQVWIDDLSLSGGGPTEEERLIARRRTLLAAVQAYREHRLADFARLAGSHWVRPIPTDPDAEPTPAVARSARSTTPNPSTTDLPGGRRLR